MRTTPLSRTGLAVLALAALPGSPAAQELVGGAEGRQGDQFGWSAAAIGDVDRDRVADWLIGAPQGFAAGEGAAGYARVLSGRDGAVLQSLFGASRAGDYGCAVAAAGDANRDGFPDYLVGARFDHGVELASGAVYLHSGINGTILQRFAGRQPRSEFGHAVAAAGDFNRDGHPDLLIGAPREDGDGRESGAVYVYSGREGALIRRIPGLHPQDGFGSSLVGLDDQNQDGRPDFAAGAPLAGERGQGRVLVISGLDGGILRTLEGENPGERFGASLALVGDVDADGGQDWAIGAPSGAEPGSVFIYSGAHGGLIQRLRGEWEGGQFGAAVAPAGDLNRDGHGDFAVGAPRDGGNGADAGLVRIYSGRDAAVLASYFGQPGERFGSALAGYTAATPESGALLATAPFAASGGKAAGMVRMFRAAAAGPAAEQRIYIPDAAFLAQGGGGAVSGEAAAGTADYDYYEDAGAAYPAQAATVNYTYNTTNYGPPYYGGYYGGYYRTGYWWPSYWYPSYWYPYYWYSDCWYPWGWYPWRPRFTFGFYFGWGWNPYWCWNSWTWAHHHHHHHGGGKGGKGNGNGGGGPPPPSGPLKAKPAPLGSGLTQSGGGSGGPAVAGAPKLRPQSLAPAGDRSGSSGGLGGGSAGGGLVTKATRVPVARIGESGQRGGIGAGGAKGSGSPGSGASGSSGSGGGSVKGLPGSPTTTVRLQPVHRRITPPPAAETPGRASGFSGERSNGPGPAVAAGGRSGTGGAPVVHSTPGGREAGSGPGGSGISRPADSRSLGTRETPSAAGRPAAAPPTQRPPSSPGVRPSNPPAGSRPAASPAPPAGRPSGGGIGPRPSGGGGGGPAARPSGGGGGGRPSSGVSSRPSGGGGGGRGRGR